MYHVTYLGLGSIFYLQRETSHDKQCNVLSTTVLLCGCLMAVYQADEAAVVLLGKRQKKRATARQRHRSQLRHVPESSQQSFVDHAHNFKCGRCVRRLTV